MLLVKVQP